MRLGDWVAASADASASLRCARRLADIEREAKSFNVAGAVEFERGNWNVAVDLFSRARLLAQSAGDRALVARIDNNEGALWAARGDRARARRHYGAALAGFRAGGEEAAAARVMNNLGLSLMEEGLAGEARALFDEATKTARRVGEADLLLITLLNSARAAAERGDLDHARTAAAEARILGDRVEGVPLLADLACALAAVALVERRWPQVEEWTRKALEVSADGKNPLAAADAHELRARARIAQGRFGDAAYEIARGREAFDALGAEAAVARLDGLVAGLRGAVR